jgi:hypothetical protein
MKPLCNNRTCQKGGAQGTDKCGCVTERLGLLLLVRFVVTNVEPRTHAPSAPAPTPAPPVGTEVAVTRSVNGMCLGLE